MIDSKIVKIINTVETMSSNEDDMPLRSKLRPNNLHTCVTSKITAGIMVVQNNLFFNLTLKFNFICLSLP